MKRVLSVLSTVVSTAVLMLMLLSVGAYAAITEKTLRVDGMTCGACSTSVEQALKKVDGIVEVKAKHGPKGTVWVKYDDQRVDLAKIRQVITDTGFVPADK